MAVRFEAVASAENLGYLQRPAQVSGQPYTRIAAFRFDDDEAPGDCLLWDMSNSAVTQWGDCETIGDNKLRLSTQSGVTDSSGGVWSDATWHRFAFVHSGNVRTVYRIDGGVVAIVTRNVADALSPDWEHLLGYETEVYSRGRAVEHEQCYAEAFTPEQLAIASQQLAPVQTTNLVAYAKLKSHTDLSDEISEDGWTAYQATPTTVAGPTDVPEVWDGPYVASSATTPGTTSAGGLSCAMPSGITAGDLLMAHAANDSSVSWSASSGWALIDDGANGSAVQGGTWAKIAAGGDTLTITGEANDIAIVVERIVNHGVSNVATDIVKGTAATGSNAAPNAPNCAPSASGKYLWIAHYASDDDDDVAQWWPAGMAPVAQIKSATGTSSCMTGVAYRWLEASSFDPAAFALSASEEWRAQTFAIPPASEGGEPVEIECETGSAVAAGVAASVSSPITIACNTGQAVAVGLSAGVASPITIAGSVGQAVAAGLSASIASTTTIQASEGAAVASGLPAGIASPLTIACGVGQAEASGLQASVSAGVVIDCSAGVAHAAGLQAGVSSPVTVSCETGAAVAAGLQAAVSSDAAISANVGAAVAAGLPATVASPKTIAAGVGQAVAAGLPVSISSGAIVLADVGRAVASGLPAQISGSLTISAGVGQAHASGLPAQIASPYTIPCGLGAAVALGLTANVSAATTIVCGVGAALAVGLHAQVEIPGTVECETGHAVAAGLPAHIESPLEIDCAVGARMALGLRAHIWDSAMRGARAANDRGYQKSPRRPPQGSPRRPPQYG